MLLRKLIDKCYKCCVFLKLITDKHDNFPNEIFGE